MTMRGAEASMPLVYLNGKQRSAGVRLLSPLMLDLVMTTSAKRQQVVADPRLRDAIIAAVARTAQLASKLVDIYKVDEIATQHGGGLSQVAIRLQVAAAMACLTRQGYWPGASLAASTGRPRGQQALATRPLGSKPPVTRR